MKRLKSVEEEIIELKRRVTEAEKAAASPLRTEIGWKGPKLCD